ncbi:Uncharacterised protein [Vibrio cholerae]|nr:Uncharacterised protein [Vibrio cholerae]
MRTRFQPVKGLLDNFPIQTVRQIITLRGGNENAR